MGPNVIGQKLLKACRDVVGQTPVSRDTWQGVETPGTKIRELCHWSMVEPVSTEDLGALRLDVEPNVPWADNHFMERVSGNPLNPGTEWQNWPWGKSASSFRIDPKKIGDLGNEPVFDHTYAQRYWPKQAGYHDGGVIQRHPRIRFENRLGIYFEYGDLGDVVRELVMEPTTRQAVLPVFFPEDTGYRPRRRKPCSLFYHFMINRSALDCTYFLRSCDALRHLRDDVYLTIRLQLWILNRLREQDVQTWGSIGPGILSMHVANLHCFERDAAALERDIETRETKQ